LDDIDSDEFSDYYHPAKSIPIATNIFRGDGGSRHAVMAEDLGGDADSGGGFDHDVRDEDCDIDHDNVHDVRDDGSGCSCQANDDNNTQQRVTSE